MFSIQGRISRKDFLKITLPLLFLIFNPISILFFVFVSIVLFQDGVDLILGTVLTIISLVFCLFLLKIISKRLHDRNKSIWWLLLFLIPYLGWLWLIIECFFLKGTTGPNQYGPDPLATNVVPPNSLRSVPVAPNVVVENQPTVTTPPVIPATQPEQMSAN